MDAGADGRRPVGINISGGLGGRTTERPGRGPCACRM